MSLRVCFQQNLTALYREYFITSLKNVTSLQQLQHSLKPQQRSLISSICTTFNESESDNASGTDSEVFYVLAGLGGGILILVFSVATMCMYFGFQLAKRRRQLLVVTAVPSHDMYTQQHHGKIIS